jgi:gamma-butyrobetaine dioxygenase
MNGIEEIAALFTGIGAREYLGERVSMAQHMLQAGSLAQAARADDALIAAALLHDVGHFRDELPGTDWVDSRHADIGATWLSQWFVLDVTEPIRLHVAAKRYLCTTEPGYLDRLSAASTHTLHLQGGPMSRREVVEFDRLLYASAAVALRRWDEQAKDPDAETPVFDDFRPLLSRLMH